MKIAALLFFTFLFYTAFAQPSGDAIAWKKGSKLIWADYKGTPKPESGAAALTATLITIGYNIGPNSFSYKITSTFQPSRSWVLHRTDHILGHEQGHFDIAEVYARKLHQRMKDYKFDKEKYQAQLRKIYEDVLKEKEEMQNEYDRETNHSIDKEKQEAWLKKIARLLRESEAYSDY